MTLRSMNAPRRRPGWLATRVLVLLAAALLSTSNAAPAFAATTVRDNGLNLLARLATAPEHPGGYERTLFVHWVDADQDGCSTRQEVLIAESRTPPQVGPNCQVSGSWRSAYDAVTTTAATSFDIDHVVPLKEAWDSGAWDWPAARRQAYANDLGDSRSLRAVSASSNRSKSDKDPAQWLPPRTAFRCTYAANWVVIKVRWQLNVDAAERTALIHILSACPAPTAKVVIVPAAPS